MFFFQTVLLKWISASTASTIEAKLFLTFVSSPGEYFPVLTLEGFFTIILKQKENRKNAYFKPTCE